MIAGVKPEDLDVSITRDMVTIKGKREESREVAENDYFYKELYRGLFHAPSLPQEIEPEEAQAVEKHGLLTPSSESGQEKSGEAQGALNHPPKKTRHTAGFVLWCLDPDSNWGPFLFRGMLYQLSYPSVFTRQNYYIAMLFQEQKITKHLTILQTHFNTRTFEKRAGCLALARRSY